MKFSQHFLDHVIEKTVLSQVIGEKVSLKQHGREKLGLCPFHKEKSPSFTVNDDKGFYYCFGCGAGGNAVNFLCEQYSYTFGDAVKELAGRAGIQLEQDSQDQYQNEEYKSQTESINTINELACNWFKEQIYGTDGTAARHYLIKRGLKKSSLDRFSVGYAPAGNHLRDFLLAKGLNESLLIASGLVIENTEKKEVYDRFRNRIMFPIYDKNSRVIAFGGRSLGDGKPKYLNSPETPVFHKGYNLYGLNLAINNVRKEKSLLLVAEGYLDVITMHQAGLNGCVAPLGTALTEDQIQILWKLSDTPVLCFDGDAAGKKASLRAAEKALPVLRPGKSLQFAFLPNGEDPDSLIQSGSIHILNKVISNPSELIDVLWQNHVAGKTIKTPEQKALIKTEAFKLVSTINDMRVSSIYKEEFKKRFFELNRLKVGRNTLQKTENLFGTRTSFDKDKQQIYILLATVLNHPYIIPRIEDLLMQIDFPSTEMSDLRNEIFSFISDDGELDKAAMRHHLINNGFEYIINKIIQPNILMHAAFAKEDASAENATAGFKEVWNLLFGNKHLKEDIKNLKNEMKNDLSPESWKRFVNLKKTMND